MVLFCWDERADYLISVLLELLLGYLIELLTFLNAINGWPTPRIPRRSTFNLRFVLFALRFATTRTSSGLLDSFCTAFLGATAVAVFWHMLSWNSTPICLFFWIHFFTNHFVILPDTDKLALQLLCCI